MATVVVPRQAGPPSVIDAVPLAEAVYCVKLAAVKPRVTDTRVDQIGRIDHHSHHNGTEACLLTEH